MRHSIFAILLLTFFSVGCQTNQLRAYERVQVGMDKHVVLEIMGSPIASSRWQSLDRWRYRFYQDDQLFVKEVHFKGGKAVYVGDEVKAATAAEEEDAHNEATNKELEAASLAKKKPQNNLYPFLKNQLKAKKNPPRSQVRGNSVNVRMH